MRWEVNFIFDPSLVAYLPLYQLDGGSFASRDAYGHLCTVAGALWRPDGHYFDNTDDYINCANDASYNITDGITLEAWVNLTSLSSAPKTHLGIIGKLDAYYLALQPATGRIIVRIYNDAEWTAVAAITEINQPKHLAITYNRSTVIIYVDGFDVEDKSQTAAINTSTSNLYIGDLTGGTSYNFHGKIPEVRIYSRAFTPQEIQHNYLATKWRYR